MDAVACLDTRDFRLFVAHPTAPRNRSTQPSGGLFSAFLSDPEASRSESAPRKSGQGDLGMSRGVGLEQVGHLRVVARYPDEGWKVDAAERIGPPPARAHGSRAPAAPPGRLPGRRSLPVLDGQTIPWRHGNRRAALQRREGGLHLRICSQRDDVDRRRRIWHQLVLDARTPGPEGVIVIGRHVPKVSGSLTARSWKTLQLRGRHRAYARPRSSPVGPDRCSSRWPPSRPMRAPSSRRTMTAGRMNDAASPTSRESRSDAAARGIDRRIAGPGRSVEAGTLGESRDPAGLVELPAVGRP